MSVHCIVLAPSTFPFPTTHQHVNTQNLFSYHDINNRLSPKNLYVDVDVDEYYDARMKKKRKHPLIKGLGYAILHPRRPKMLIMG